MRSDFTPVLRVAPVRPLTGRVVALSTHLDDAVLSVGAGLAAAARRGADVRVATVLSGDPGQTVAADRKNAYAGFRTAGAAAEARQAEDSAACALIGARPQWLGFSDDANDARPEDGMIAATVRSAVAHADVVLIGGWPLRHADHCWLTRLSLSVLEPGTTVALFIEQPYATWDVASREHGVHPRRLVSRPEPVPPIPVGARWRRLPANARDRYAKVRAMRAYRSQLRVLRRWVLPRMVAYEFLQGGEFVTWCTVADDARTPADE